MATTVLNHQFTYLSRSQIHRICHTSLRLSMRIKLQQSFRIRQIAIMQHSCLNVSESVSNNCSNRNAHMLPRRHSSIFPPTRMYFRCNVCIHASRTTICMRVVFRPRWPRCLVMKMPRCATQTYLVPFLFRHMQIHSKRLLRIWTTIWS